MPEVNMPRLSDTMQEGTITRWLKQPGDQVKRGDIVAEVETDKANMEIEAYDSGVLEQILVKEGEIAPIGQAIALIGDGSGTRKQEQAAPSNGARSNAETSATTINDNVPVQSALPPVQSHVEEELSLQASGVRLKASPLARRIAEEHGIDLKQVKGTGPGGRIVRDDIEDFMDQQGAQPAFTIQQPAVPPVEVQEALPEDVEVKKMSSMQKTIARRLTESKQTVPHFYVRNEIDLTDALALRKTLNESVDEESVKVSVNDLIVKACALALEKFPEVNGSYNDGQFIYHKHINIGIAVDIPSGLVVPVIRDANLKGVRTIAREARTLIEKARDGKLTTQDLTGGTFSVSNLGMMDVADFVAVINPPEAAILAVASARKTFVPINDQPVLRDILPLTMSADHRILYGATVARFLQEVKRLLQKPYTLLG